MSSLFQAPVDLLRQRRIEVGLPGDPAKGQKAWRLMLLGGLLGGGMFLPALGLQLALGFWDSQVETQLAEVRP